MLHPYEMTVNGYEYHWAVNVLANALLIDLLKPYILRSSSPFPRIVCVGSSTCAAGRIGENLVEGTMGGLRYFNGYQAYADSKLALAAYIDRLATDQLRESSIGRDNRITVYTVHPGVVPGRLYKNTLRPIQWLIGTWIGRLVLRSSTAAAFDVVNLCFNKDIIPGGYYEYGNRVTLPLDETVKKRVFESVNEAICG